MLTRRGLWIGAACAIAGVAFVAPAGAQDWQAEWKAAQDKARGQALNIVLQPNDAFESTVDAFQKKFPGIKVSTSVIHPSQAAPRIVTEQKNNLYAWDVWWATASNMNGIVLPVGGFEKITDFMILPEVKDPANWQDARFLYTSDKGPYVFVHTHYLQNLGLYNTDLVPGKTLTLDTLLDPALKKKIAIRVPSRPHGGSMMLAQMAKDKGSDYVRKVMVDQEPIYLDNDRQNTLNVIKGEVAASIGVSDEVYFECVQAGGCKNIKQFPVSFMHSRGIGVLKNAPNKDATKVFVNWILSKEGQEVYVREWAKHNSSGAFSMRKDVAPDPKHLDTIPDFSKLDKYVAVSRDSGAEEIDAIIKLYNDTRKR